MFTVYKHTCPNGKVYIGITSQPVELRWRNGAGYSNNPYFANAIKRYGWENIKHEILDTELAPEVAYQREQELIRKYDSTNREKGYNISFGGKSTFLGQHHTDEAKSKISEAGKGRKMPDKAREIITAYVTNKRKEVVVYNTKGELLYECHSICEASNKTGIETGLITACCKGKYRQMKGYVFAYEGDPFPKQSHRNIPILQFSKNGEFVKEYPTAKEAARSLGVAQVHITSCCIGKQALCKGYKLYYATEVN